MEKKDKVEKRETHEATANENTLQCGEEVDEEEMVIQIPAHEIN